MSKHMSNCVDHSDNHTYEYVSHALGCTVRSTFSTLVLVLATLLHTLVEIPLGGYTLSRYAVLAIGRVLLLMLCTELL